MMERVKPETEVEWNEFQLGSMVKAMQLGRGFEPWSHGWWRFMPWVSRPAGSEHSWRKITPLTIADNC